MKISEEAIYVDGRAKTARAKRAAYETTDELEAVLNRYVPEGEKSQFIRKAIAAALADMIPAEPLIKDEKDRKAVRAWAEALEIENNPVKCYGCGTWIGLLYERPSYAYTSKFEIDKPYCEYNLELDRYYTIAELCGEEEE